MVSGESGVLVGEAGKNQPLEGTPALQEGGWITPGQVIWLSYQRSGPIIWLSQLDDLVETRKREMPKDSYTTKLFNRGSEYIAQKLVEESGETAIAAVAQSKEQFLEEASDLMFHLLVLLHERGMNLATLSKHLEGRHR
jgi:phosphoribosyl-ATP pyrophosphohydrolase/phosphoribosyl-AMP cyclohydrolase